jgi:hypothetical protein
MLVVGQKKPNVLFVRWHLIMLIFVFLLYVANYQLFMSFFTLGGNGHLYVVGRDFWKKSCQTRRKVGARSDLSDR